MSSPEKKIICPKCGHDSGDAWEQCEGSCPMTMSPHYNADEIENLKAREATLAWLEQLKVDGKVIDYSYDPATHIASVRLFKPVPYIKLTRATDGTFDEVMDSLGDS